MNFGSENVVATLKIEIFEFFIKDAAKNLLLDLPIRLIPALAKVFNH